MATTTKQMPKPTPSGEKRERKPRVPTSDKDASALFKKKGARILKTIDRQARILERVVKGSTTGARGTRAQIDYLRTQVDALAEKLTRAAQGEAAASVDAFPDA